MNDGVIRLLRRLTACVLLLVLTSAALFFLAPVLPVQAQRSLAGFLPHLPGAHAQHELSMAGDALATEIKLVSSSDGEVLASWPPLEARWVADEGLQVRLPLLLSLLGLSALAGLALGFLWGIPESRQPVGLGLLLGFILGAGAVSCLRSESSVVAWPVIRGLSGLPGLTETGGLGLATGMDGAALLGDRHLSTSAGVLVSFNAGPPPWDKAPRGELSRQLLWCAGYASVFCLGLILLRLSLRSVRLPRALAQAALGVGLVVFTSLPFLPVVLQQGARSGVAALPAVLQDSVPSRFLPLDRESLSLVSCQLLESPGLGGDWRFQRGAVLRVHPPLLIVISLIAAVILSPVYVLLGLKRRLAARRARLDLEEEEASADTSIPLLDDDDEGEFERIHEDD